jgi:hypothetical protein
LLAFAVYVNEDGTKVTGLQVHPDSDSLLFHLAQVDEEMNRAFEMITTESITSCGDLDEKLKPFLEQVAASGVSLNVIPEPLSGFTRLPAG